MSSVDLGTSSLQLQQLEDALNSADLTGWKVLAVVVVLAMAYPVGILVRRLTIRGLKRVPNLPVEVAEDGGRIAAWLVYLIAAAWAVSLLGFSVGWVAIVVAVLVILAVLMIKPMIENSAAGLLLTIRPSFGVDDQIETAGYRGTVIEIGSRSTVLRTSDSRRIHIPNTQVLSHPIVVYTAFDARKTDFDVTVVYGTDLDAATRLLVNAISRVDGVQDDPAPQVQATGFRNNAITLSIGYSYPSWMASGSAVTDGVIRAVTTALTQAHIELAVPTIDVEKAPSPVTVDDHSSDASTGTPTDQREDS